MAVRFTLSARSQLMETLVRLRDADREAAFDFLDRTEMALDDLDDQESEGDDVPRRRTLPYLGEQHRFFYRRKGDTVWVLAVL
jgi:hypothetical protein